MLDFYLGTLGGTTIGVTSGCFDILHPLHVQYLEKCKSQCEVLIVGVDSDKLIYESKKKKPVFSEHDRAFMISALHVVDIAFVMDKITDLENVIGTLTLSKHDHEVKLFKAQSEYYGKPTIMPKGVDLVHIPDVFPINSTTELVQFIQNDYQRL